MDNAVFIYSLSLKMGGNLNRTTKKLCRCHSFTVSYDRGVETGCQTDVCSRKDQGVRKEREANRSLLAAAVLIFFSTSMAEFPLVKPAFPQDSFQMQSQTSTARYRSRRLPLQRTTSVSGPVCRWPGLQVPGSHPKLPARFNALATRFVQRTRRAATDWGWSICTVTREGLASPSLFSMVPWFAWTPRGVWRRSHQIRRMRSSMLPLRIRRDRLWPNPPLIYLCLYTVERVPQDQPPLALVLPGCSEITLGKKTTVLGLPGFIDWEETIEDMSEAALRVEKE